MGRTERSSRERRGGVASEARGGMGRAVVKSSKPLGSPPWAHLPGLPHTARSRGIRDGCKVLGPCCSWLGGSCPGTHPIQISAPTMLTLISSLLLLHTRDFMFRFEYFFIFTHVPRWLYKGCLCSNLRAFRCPAPL